LPFYVAQQLSEPQLGYTENDDCAGWVRTPRASFAWVIDGSTSVAADKSHLGAARNDVAWYSQALSEALCNHADHAQSARHLHACAAAEVARAYESAVGAALASVPVHARPSAAITVLRLEESGGELFYLGDCPAFALSVTGEVTRLTDRQRTDGEEDSRERVRASLSVKPLSAREIFQEHLEWLQQGRDRQLRARPLQVSAAIGAVIFGGWERSFALHDLSAILLMSDGFERYTAYYQLGGYDELVRASVQWGPGSILRQIRQLERDDPDCRAVPRLKASDDATCLVLKPGTE
jgi:hypothetical protein